MSNTFRRRMVVGPFANIAATARALSGALLLSSAAPPSDAASSSAPEQAQEQFELSRSWADSGNAEAMEKVADAFASGAGVKTDFEKAVQYYTKAASRGNLAAYLKLGRCYEEGRGTSKNAGIAAQCYLAAANGRSPAGSYEYALCLAAGAGVARNEPSAAKFLRASATAGHAPAQEALQQAERAGLRSVFDVAIKGASPSPRWGAEVSRLFQAMSFGYWLGLANIPATPSAATVARSAESPNALLALIAQTFRRAANFQAEADHYGASAATAQKEYEASPAGNTLFKLRAFGNPDHPTNDTVRAAEMTVGEALNTALAAELRAKLGRVSEINSVLEKSRQFLEQTKPDLPIRPQSIATRILVPAWDQTALAITNQSKTALEHCVILTRVIIDKQRVKANYDANAPGRSAGRLMREFSGYDAELSGSTKDYVDLKDQAPYSDLGFFVYVPHLPAGATVSFPLCHPDALMDTCLKVDTSMWWDEGKLLDVTAPNLAEVKPHYVRLFEQFMRAQKGHSSGGGRTPGFSAPGGKDAGGGSGQPGPLGAPKLQTSGGLGPSPKL